MGTSVATARHPPLTSRVVQIYRSPLVQTFATTFAIIILGLISGIQIARALGPHGRGQVAAALLWPGLLVYFASLGLAQAVVVFAATASEREEISTVFSTAAFLGLILSGVALSLGATLIPVLLRSQSPEVIRASRWFLISIPPGMFSGFAVAVLQGRCRFFEFNALRSVVPVGYVVGLAALLAAHALSVMSVVVLQLALSYATCLLAWIVLGKDGIKLSAGNFQIPVAKRLLSFGLRAYAGTLSGTLNQRLDQVLIAAWFPAAQLGLYSVAVSAAGATDTISFAFRTVASGRIAQQASFAEKHLELRRILRRFCPTLLMGVAVLAGLIPHLVPAFYGPGFRDAIPVAEALLVAQMLYAGKTLLTTAAEAFGDSWMGSKAELIGLLPMVVLLTSFLPRWGILGAALASVMTSLIQLGVMLLGFLRKKRGCLT